MNDYKKEIILEAYRIFNRLMTFEEAFRLLEENGY